jgi:glucan 1,3-beta-glucosidase
MKLISAAIFSAFVLGGACEQFKIPEVENIVQGVLEHFGDYVHFQGNHSKSSAAAKRQSTAYWYENINHQGISAFGPSGYQVYRNVKDYGATGKSTMSAKIRSLLIGKLFFKAMVLQMIQLLSMLL